MTEFEAEMIEVVTEVLEEFGFPVFIDSLIGSKYVPGTLAVTPPVAPVTTVGIAAFIDPSNSNLTGYESNLNEENVPGRKWMYIRTASVLKTGFTIRYGAKSGIVKSCTEIGPTETVLVHRLAIDIVK